MNETSNIGRYLNSNRKKKKLSLDKLSELTGVSKAMLGQIERGESSPTVNTLWKIATGLKVSFSSLLARAQEDKELLLVPFSGIDPVIENDGKMKIYPIMVFDSSRGFEMFILELEPGCNHESDPHNDGVEEYITVTEGTMELIYEDELYTLTKGDTIRYYANKRHIYRNISDERATFQHIIYYL